MSIHPYLNVGFGFILVDEENCPWNDFDPDYMGYNMPFDHWWEEVVKVDQWLEIITSGFDGDGQDALVLKSTYEHGEPNDWGYEFHTPGMSITAEEQKTLNDFIEKYDIEVTTKYPALVVGMEWT